MRITLYALMDSSFWIDANSVDPYEMRYYAAFYLALQCLQLKVQICYAFIPLFISPNGREGVHIVFGAGSFDVASFLCVIL